MRAEANKNIAYELHLAEGTIKEYLNRIYTKLGLHNRTELAVWAIGPGKETYAELRDSADALLERVG